MNRHHPVFVLVVGLLLLLVAPGVASAGVGDDCLVDDPSTIQISPEDQAEYDEEQAKFQQWLADRKALQTAAATGSTKTPRCARQRLVQLLQHDEPQAES